MELQISTFDVDHVTHRKGESGKRHAAGCSTEFARVFFWIAQVDVAEYKVQAGLLNLRSGSSVVKAFGKYLDRPGFKP